MSTQHESTTARRGGLREVGDGVHAWIAQSGTWGYSNAGLIMGADGSALVDTLYDLRMTRELLDAVDPLLAGRPLADLVNTHGNGDHCFGNQLVAADVRVHAAPEAAATLEAESPHELAALLRQDLGPVLTPYLQRCFGDFEFDDIEVVPADVLVGQDTTLPVGGRPVRLLSFPPAHTGGDLAVHVPDAGVVFAGDLLFVDGTPVMWAGPLDNWIDALDRLLDLDAEVFVPGHGPVTDRDGVRTAQDYLRHVRAGIRDAKEAGRSWQQACAEIDLGPFAALPDAERLVVTTYAEYRGLGDTSPPATPADLFSVMAGWADGRS